MNDDTKITISLKELKTAVSYVSFNAITRYVVDLQKDNKLPFDLVKFSKRQEISDEIVDDLEKIIKGKNY